MSHGGYYAMSPNSRKLRGMPVKELETMVDKLCHWICSLDLAMMTAIHS